MRNVGIVIFFAVMTIPLVEIFALCCPTWAGIKQGVKRLIGVGMMSTVFMVYLAAAFVILRIAWMLL